MNLYSGDDWDADWIFEGDVRAHTGRETAGNIDTGDSNTYGTDRAIAVNVDTHDGP